MIQNIETLYFPATNPAKTGQWYAENFGLKPWKPENYSSVVLNSGQTIMFVERKEAKTLSFENSEGYDMFSVTFKVDNVIELYNELKNKGFDVGECNNDGNCGYNFKLYDPDGNRIHLWGGYPETE